MCGALVLAAVAKGNPEAIESANFVMNNPDSSMLLAGLKGQLPFDTANKAYQLLVAGLGTGLAAAGLAKVAQSFKSLRDETEHLKRENQILKSSIATDHAVPSGEAKSADSLKSLFNKGLDNVSARSEPRHEHAQATRISSGPKLQ
ncbi:hypothetical protein D3C77_468320 [compost metagenome]